MGLQLVVALVSVVVVHLVVVSVLVVVMPVLVGVPVAVSVATVLPVLWHLSYAVESMGLQLVDSLVSLPVVCIVPFAVVIVPEDLIHYFALLLSPSGYSTCPLSFPLLSSSHSLFLLQHHL